MMLSSRNISSERCWPCRTLWRTLGHLLSLRQLRSDKFFSRSSGAIRAKYRNSDISNRNIYQVWPTMPRPGSGLESLKGGSLAVRGGEEVCWPCPGPSPLALLWSSEYQRERERERERDQHYWQTPWAEEDWWTVECILKMLIIILQLFYNPSQLIVSISDTVPY